ncbi:MAG TPA: AI-2E family transporter [Ktedonobacterales bacterium]|nr:AI-2E family transporter [Ktedonobacterales bacterium]
MHHPDRSPAEDGAVGAAQSALLPLRRHLTIAIEARTLWLAAAIILTFVVASFVFERALGVFIVFFIAIILAEGLRPLVDALYRRRMPRALAVLLIFLGIIAVLSGLAYLLIQPLLDQIAAFIAALPAYVVQAQRLLTQLQELASGNPQIASGVQLIEDQMGSLLSQGVPLLLQAPLAVGDIVFNGLLVLVLTFLWLTSIQRLRPFVLGLLPGSAQPTADAVISDIGRKLGGYFRGVLVNMVVIGTLSGLGLWALGVPYPALLGVLAGLTEIIPFLGPWISGAVAVTVAALAVDPLKAGQVVILFMALQQIEGNTLLPIVMNRTVELNPLLIVVAVLLGGALFGLAGSVLAVPLAAVVEVFIMRVLAPAARRASARVDEKAAAEAALGISPVPPSPPPTLPAPHAPSPTEPPEPPIGSKI